MKTDTQKSPMKFFTIEQIADCVATSRREPFGAGLRKGFWSPIGSTGWFESPRRISKPF